MSNIEVKESGKLEDKPALPRILGVLETPFKGVLIFVRGKDRKSFVLDNGKPLLSNQLFQESALGKTLLEKNLIQEDQFKKIKEIEATGKTFFQATLDVLPPVTVYDLLIEPWLEDLATVLGWDIGQFANVEFMPKDVTKIDTPRPMISILFQAVLRKNKKRKTKLSPNARFEIEQQQNWPYKIEDLLFSENQKKIYDVIQGKTIKLIAKEMGTSEDAISPTVYSLRELGAIRADSDPRKKIQVTPVVQVQVETAPPDDKDFFAKIQKMNELDYFGLLGVTNKSTPKEIQDMYFSLAKKYHPDRIKNVPNAPVKEAEKLFTKITEAYNTLSNAQLRKEYEMNSSHQAIEHEKLMRKIVDSEGIYLEGKALLTKGQFKEAAERIQHAIRLYDQEPEYFVKLGWALFRHGVKDKLDPKIQEAKKVLMDSYNKGYHVAEVSYYLGMFFKQENNMAQSIKFFTNCIKLDPSHHLASSELRAWDKKRDSAAGRKK